MGSVKFDWNIYSSLFRPVKSYALLLLLFFSFSCDNDSEEIAFPEISAIPNQVIPVNSSMGPVSFMVNDPGGDENTLVIRAASNNQDLVPDSRIELGGSGRDRTIAITPSDGRRGTTQITVVATSGQLSAEEKFTLTVDYPNSIWKQVASGTDKNINAVYFHDSMLGWIAGDQGLIFYTRDGGNSWNASDNLLADNLNDIVFIDNLKGFAAGDFSENGTIKGQILQSLDGGVTWDQVFIQEAPLNALYFYNFLFGYAVGDKGQVVITVDGGGNWLTSKTSGGEDLHAVFFIEPKIGFAGGEDGKLYISNNTGATWNQQAQVKDITIQSLFFYDSFNGWLSGGSNTIAKSTNEGISWNDFDPSNGFIADTWHQVFFVDEGKGWIIGEEGRIFRSEDGGVGWNYEIVDTKQTLLDIHMIHDNLGWIVGEQGTLLKYDLE